MTDFNDRWNIEIYELEFPEDVVIDCGSKNVPVTKKGEINCTGWSAIDKMFKEWYDFGGHDWMNDLHENNTCTIRIVIHDLEEDKVVYDKKIKFFLEYSPDFVWYEDNGK